MDNPTTLLVAIMFVTIIVTGLVSVLMSISTWVTGEQKFTPLYISWLFFLLVTYLLYFWNTTLLLEIEGWSFLSFIGFIMGPISLLFATNLLIVEPNNEEPEEADRHFFNASRRFFALLFAVQVWLVGLDFSFDSIDSPTYLAGFSGMVFLVLSVTGNERAHRAGMALAWISLLAQVVYESLA